MSVIRDGRGLVVSGLARRAFHRGSGRGAGSGASRLLGALVGVVAVFGVVPVAQAAKYVDSFFGNPTTSSGSTGGLFSTASPGVAGVAVHDVSGAVYVVDRGNHRVQQFDSANAFVRAWGRDVVSTGSEQADEQQLLTVNASAGQFRLTFGANTTADIAFDAPAATVQAELNALASINTGGGSVTVTGGPGGPGGSTPYVIAFDGGPRADVNQPAITTAAGTVPLAGTVAVATVNDGAVGFEVCTIAANCKAGSSAGSAGGDFNTPAGVAVNQSSGHVYVTDGGRLRVQEFTANGQFVRAWGKDVITTGAPNDVSTTAFEVCDTTAGNYTHQCKAGSTTTPGEGGAFRATFNGYPAIVPAGAPNAGNVLVADPGNRRVQEFTANGAFVRAFGFDVAKTGSPGDDTDTDGPGSDLAGQFEVCTAIDDCQQGSAGSAVGQFGSATPTRVAADTTGAIYTVESASNFRVQKFSIRPGSPPLGAEVFAPDHLGQAPGGALATTPGSTPTDVAFDPATGRVLVARNYNPALAGHGPFFAICSNPATERRVLELSPTGNLRDTHLSCAGLAAVANTTNGLAIRSTTGDLYFSATTLGHRVWKADHDGITPGISTVDPATNVTTSSADLSGTANPNSVDNAFSPTLWRVQVSDDGVDWVTVSSGSIVAANTTPVEVSGSATGLRPNTLYRVRVVTQKPFGNPEVSSPELTFLTDAVPPEVRTESVQAVGESSVTLSARVNPHSSPTSYRFEWGQGSFSNVTPVPSASVGSGPDFVYVAQHLTGLAPDTTYQYRVVAVSAEGTTTGPTRTFTTGTGAEMGARGFELVSPADKVGGQGVGVWYAGYASHSTVGDPAFDGDRFASIAYYGGVLMDGAFSWGGDSALAQRTTAGWVNQPAFNRAGGQGEPELFRIPQISAHSDDLSLTAWETTNKGIKIFAEQEDVWGRGNTGAEAPALREWESGRWEIIAPLLQEQNATDGAKGAIDGTLIAPGGGYALTFGQLRGVEGPGDPTHPSWPDLVCAIGPPTNKCNGSVYIDDVTGGLSDTYPGAGIRSLVNVCTGAGAARTAIPAIDGLDDISAEACPLPAGPDKRLISPRGASIDTHRAGTISADGSRVFFVSPDSANTTACSGTGAVGTACPPQLFVRQRQPNGEVVTRWISRSRSTPTGGGYGGGLIAGQDSSLMSTVVFEGASRDGDKVYFRTLSPLTPDDPNGDIQVAGGATDGPVDPESTDLYMYDLPDSPGADPGDGTLTRVSAGPTGAGDGNVSRLASEAALRFAAPDGSPRAYFVTAAPLPDVAAAGDGTITSQGGTSSEASAKNLYLYDGTLPVEERWRFIARLSATSPLGGCATTGGEKGDGLGPQASTGVEVLARNASSCVRGNSDGSFVRFFTDARLTADDPDSVSGDLYAYDADRDDLTRISATQGGAGGSYVCVTEGAGLGTRCNADGSLRINNLVSPALGVVTNPSAVGDRVAFFQSQSRLVPGDHNDVYDVYQWRNGELSLVSTGAEGADHALYQGNDRTGTNVYVSTRDRLTWQDHDAVLDVYVARAGSSGIPQPPEPVVCGVLADRCQEPGAGNPVAVSPLQTAEGGGGNAAPTARSSLSVAAVGAKARRRAARSGILALRVRVGAAGTVSAVARARVAGRRGRPRLRRVAAGDVQAHRAGVVSVRLGLSRLARRQLRSGRGLRLGVVVAMDGARSRSMSIVLRRAGR
jgi:NHL repeat